MPSKQAQKGSGWLRYPPTSSQGPDLLIRLSAVQSARGGKKLVELDDSAGFDLGHPIDRSGEHIGGLLKAVPVTVCQAIAQLDDAPRIVREGIEKLLNASILAVPEPLLNLPSVDLVLCGSVHNTSIALPSCR